jgi:hypothetical protein
MKQMWMKPPPSHRAGNQAPERNRGAVTHLRRAGGISAERAARHVPHDRTGGGRGRRVALSPGGGLSSYRNGRVPHLGYPVRSCSSTGPRQARASHARPPQHLPICISVGTCHHAAGAAMAVHYQRDPIAVVAYFGDGASRETFTRAIWRGCSNRRRIHLPG